MKNYEQAILENVANPIPLEQLYQEDPQAFCSALPLVLESHQDSLVLQVWSARLLNTPAKPDVPTSSTSKIFIVIALAILSAVLVNIPTIFGLQGSSAEYCWRTYYAISLLPTALYLIFCRKASLVTNGVTVGGFIIEVIYVNLLMTDTKSETTMLVWIHLPLFLVMLNAVAFIGNMPDKYQGLMDYVKLIGESILYTMLLYLGGIVLVAIVMSLFRNELVFRLISIGGIAAAPVVAVHLATIRGHLNRNIAPLIAKIFAPLILLILIALIGSSLLNADTQLTDRNFLLAFDCVMVVVLALIVYSVSERDDHTKKVFSDVANILLISCTIIANSMALAAIFTRLYSFGVTPNRCVISGLNLLIFINLGLVLFSYIQFWLGKTSFTTVKNSILHYLPVYSLWVAIVIFLFPLLFKFQ